MNLDENDPLITDTGESYRDSIATIDKSGNRVWIYPKKPSGKLHRRRIVVALILLLMLFVIPFIKINNHQLLLFDFINRHFIIFGKSFWPQDFFIFAICFLALIFFIVLFTLAYGRIWCGWACPQTIFMEMVFRKIEYFIEGDASSQRKLNASVWNFNKFWRKSLKHGIFFGISFLIGNLLLSYIIGTEELFKIISAPPGQHLGGLSAMLIFSFVFYGIFAWFREQACTIVCPYGRLQGVLLDKNSIVVAYDDRRGEPRGKLRKINKSNAKGDCIDCNMCVDVCPTGIDIRNGTQLECINCTACIDACNNVMREINKPEHLIKYASYKQIKDGQKFIFNARLWLLTIGMVLIAGIIVLLIVSRQNYIANVMRAPGTTYQEIEGNYYANFYKLKYVNKTFEKKSINLGLESSPIGSKIKLIGYENLTVQADSILEASFYVMVPKEELKSARTRVEIKLSDEEGLIETFKTVFMGPVK